MFIYNSAFSPSIGGMGDLLMILSTALGKKK